MNSQIKQILLHAKQDWTPQELEDAVNGVKGLLEKITQGTKINFKVEEPYLFEPGDIRKAAEKSNEMQRETYEKANKQIKGNAFLEEAIASAELSGTESISYEKAIRKQFGEELIKTIETMKLGIDSNSRVAMIHNSFLEEILYLISHSF